MARERETAAISLAAATALLLAAAPTVHAWTIQDPAEQGRVVLARFSTTAGMEPVQFEHWVHRARYTCRVCHVDVGFAMTAGETKASASTNRQGFHCGACHDGKTAVAGKVTFAACGDGKRGDSRCKRCHTRVDAAERAKAYARFAAGMPRARSGAVDWEAAEATWKIHPIDHVEGVSIARDAIRRDQDVTITSQGWMADVVFSHRKHAAWNGCEVCHPDIFPPAQGAVRYTMVQISSGEACGACHGKVAFDLGECDRCHATPTRSRSR